MHDGLMTKGTMLNLRSFNSPGRLPKLLSKTDPPPHLRDEAKPRIVRICSRRSPLVREKWGESGAKDFAGI
jgi:hypothetical protein